MEARDGSSPIRPLPPEPIEGQPRVARGPAQRRWAPLALAGLALVVVVALSGLLVDDDAVESAAGPSSTTSTSSTTTVPPLASGSASVTTTTAPTTTLPPTLDQFIPGFTGILAAVGHDESFGVLLLWSATERDPRVTALTGRPDVAAFDAAGVWLGYLSLADGPDGALHVGLRTQRQPAQFLDVTSFAWHASDRGRIAWIAHRPLTDVRVLYEGRVEEITGDLDEIREVAEVDPDDRLVAWGSWGFAIDHAPVAGPLEVSAASTPEATFGVRLLTIYDLAGSPVVTSPGELRGSTGEGVLLIDPPPGYLDTLQELGVTPQEAGFRGAVSIPDRADPYLADSSLDQLPTPRGLTRAAALLLMPDGSRVVMVRPTSGNRHSITTLDVAGRGTRIASVEGPIGVLGFSAEGRYVALQRVDPSSATEFGALILVDWQNGAEFELPILPDLEIAAFRLD